MYCVQVFVFWDLDSPLDVTNWERHEHGTKFWALAIIINVPFS